MGSEHGGLPVWRFPNTVVSLYCICKYFPWGKLIWSYNILDHGIGTRGWLACKMGRSRFGRKNKIIIVFAMFPIWFLMALRDVISMVSHPWSPTHGLPPSSPTHGLPPMVSHPWSPTMVSHPWSPIMVSHPWSPTHGLFHVKPWNAV